MNSADRQRTMGLTSMRERILLLTQFISFHSPVLLVRTWFFWHQNVPQPRKQASKQTDHNLDLIEAPLASLQLTQTCMLLTENPLKAPRAGMKAAPVKVECDGKQVAELNQLWGKRPKNRKTDLPPDEKWENNRGGERHSALSAVQDGVLVR